MTSLIFPPPARFLSHLGPSSGQRLVRGQDSGISRAEVKAFKWGWQSLLYGLGSSQHSGRLPPWRVSRSLSDLWGPPLPVCGPPGSDALQQAWPCCSSCRSPFSELGAWAFAFTPQLQARPPQPRPLSAFSPSPGQTKSRDSPSAIPCPWSVARAVLAEGGPGGVGQAVLTAIGAVLRKGGGTWSEDHARPGGSPGLELQSKGRMGQGMSLGKAPTRRLGRQEGREASERDGGGGGSGGG